MEFRWKSLRGVLAAASIAGLLFIVPHTTEDFLHNVPEDRFNLDQTFALWMTGPLLALQVAGLLLLVGGRRSGVWITGLAGAGWVLAAVLDHTGDILDQPFRTGFSSTVWVLGIIATQAAAGAAAALLLARERHHPRVVCEQGTGG